VEFLDEEAFEPGGAPAASSRRGPPRDPHRQILARRLIALGAAILILVLLVLGVKGCLNARKERGFENYVSDLSSVVAQTKQLSADFFGQLNSPGKLSELSFRAQISADAGTAEGLLTNAQNLDTPDEVKSAQSELVESYELLRDGLAGIDSNMQDALSSDAAAANRADEAIANYMRYFVARDVLFAQAQTEIDQVLSDQGIEVGGKPAKVPDSVFIDDDAWLDPLKVRTALTAVAGTNAATPGVHGTELTATTVKPGDVALTAGTPVTVSGSGPFTLEVQVTNGPENEESDVLVTVEVTGGPQTISGEATIPRIVPGGTQTASIELKPSPPAGQEVSVQVTVQPVPGETLTTNNTATYPVTFGG
jgi:hypothetical protein